MWKKTDVVFGDIESYPNFFCLGLNNFRTGETQLYEISEEKDDRKSFYNFLDNYNGFFVTFNGISYDNTVLMYFYQNYKKLSLLNWFELVLQLKRFSNKVINDDEYYDEIKKYRWAKFKWTDIDLLLYWSMNLRKSKQLSLKALAIQLHYPVIQPLPYEHTEYLKKEMLPVLRVYNTVHDLGILKKLFITMKGEIKLREFVSEKYKIDAWSMDSPKIVSEVMLREYCKLTNKNVNETRKIRYEEFTGKIKDLFPKMPFTFETPQLIKIQEEIMESDRSFNKRFPIESGHTLIMMSMGIGGQHTLVKNLKVKTKDKQIQVSSDVVSLYPNIIINELCIRFPEVLEIYSNIKTIRMDAKLNGRKLEDKFFKLCLNALSGLLDNEHSWLYFPAGALKMRIYGQLFILKALDICLIKSWKVVATNTDSIDVLIDEDQYDEYVDTMNKFAKKCFYEFEHENIDFTYYKDINNYIQKSKKGTIKRKGLFKLDKNEYGELEIPLGDSVDELVIPKILNLFYTKDISPEEIIKNPEKHGLHIYDFCKSNKINKQYKVIYNGKTIQNLNRYYFSKLAPYLYKKKNTKNTLENVNVGMGVMLFNTYRENSFDGYEINYNYYLSKVKEIISEINNKEQLKLF